MPEAARAAARNIASPKTVAALLGEIGVKPNKTLGQNFLIDGNTLARIAEEAALTPQSRVLEVGPGLGSLTERLLPRCARLTAIEKDPALAAYLRKRFAVEIGAGRMALMEGDALDCGMRGIFDSGEADALVSNLPYSVGTRVVVEAALGAAPPRSITVMLQKEVAARIGAAPRTADYGALSVWLQTLYTAAPARRVPPSCFWPPPEVFSAVVALRLRGVIPAHGARLKLHALAKAAFMNRRKQLASSMRSAQGGLARDADFIRRALHACGAAPAARPEELSAAQWLALSENW